MFWAYQLAMVVCRSNALGCTKTPERNDFLIPTQYNRLNPRLELYPRFISSFHFYREESLKLLKKLENLQNEEIEVNDIVTEFTLNNVIGKLYTKKKIASINEIKKYVYLETALGVKLDNISGNDLYRKTIHEIEEVILERIYNPLMYYGIIFKLFGRYAKHKKDLKVASDFSSKIIEKKREEYQQKQAIQEEEDV